MSRSMSARGVVCVSVMLLLVGSVWADDFMGEYEGTFIPDKQVTIKATADVVAEGDGNYRIVIEAKTNESDRDGAFVEVYGKQGGQAVMVDKASFGGYQWKGEIKNGRLTLGTQYGLRFELKKVENESPTAGMKPPAEAVVLLPFKKGQKADLSKWTTGKEETWKSLDNGVMECVPKKGSIRTKESFGDIERLHIEFKLPLEPENRGQGRANSGVYLSGKYEVQILDSFGLVHTSGDCGGIYNLRRTTVNACLPPETWQTYDITFKLERVGANGNVKENPRITVEHNGRTIHKNLEIPAKRPGQKGPILLQDHKHAIQFRNIWLVEG